MGEEENEMEQLQRFAAEQGIDPDSDQVQVSHDIPPLSYNVYQEEEEVVPGTPPPITYGEVFGGE